MKIKSNDEYEQICKTVRILNTMENPTPAIRARIRALTDAIIDYELEHYPEEFKSFQQAIPERLR